MTLADWQVFIFSAVPLTELRVTIPLALAYGMAPVKAYILAVLGNLLPVIPALLLLDPLSRLLVRYPLIDRLFRKILARSRRKGAQVQKYGVIGLLLFVALPLPMTGAWTGIILAWLLGLDFWPAVLAIGLGVMVAGVIMTLASLGVIKVAVMYDLSTAFFILAAAMLLFVWLRKKKNDN